MPEEKTAVPLKVTMAAGGYAHTVALCENGTVWGWGGNYIGQLGYGVKPDDYHDTSINRKTPVQVNTIDDSGRFVYEYIPPQIVHGQKKPHEISATESAATSQYIPSSTAYSIISTT